MSARPCCFREFYPGGAPGRALSRPAPSRLLKVTDSGGLPAFADIESAESFGPPFWAHRHGLTTVGASFAYFDAKRGFKIVQSPAFSCGDSGTLLLFGVNLSPQQEEGDLRCVT